jgi:hypothetical protein
MTALPRTLTLRLAPEDRPWPTRLPVREVLRREFGGACVRCGLEAEEHMTREVCAIGPGTTAATR